MKIFDRYRVCREDFVDSGDGELAKDAEFVQLLVVDRDVDVTGFLRDDDYWARPWRCRMLDEARGEEFIQNHVHFLDGRRIDAVVSGRDGRAVWRN